MGKDPKNRREEGAQRLRPSRLAWLPIPILFGAMVVLWAAALPGSYESPHLVLALNFVFSTLVSLFIAYLVGRSFLVRSTPGLLLLGCGVIFWGLASVVGTVVAHGDANISITIHNSCVWLSALCHLAGVVLSLRPRRSLTPTSVWLVAAYLHVTGAVALIALAAHAGWIPTFFVNGQGGTPLRHLVLISAVVMFALTASLLSATSRRPLSAFAHWYALALTLIVVGLCGVALQSVRASILGWTGRATQLLGGLYMLVAAVASVRESHVWGISLEEALRGTEQRLRLALDTARMGMWDWDLTSGDVIWNEEHCHLLGYEPGRVKPSYQAWAQRVHPDDLAAAQAVLRRSMEQCTDYTAEYRTRWPDGTVHWAEARGRFEPAAGGKAVRSYGVLIDITERRRTEEALRELNATLENRVAQRTAELGHRARQLQKLALELSQAEERERRRIAVLLHEDLQQQIAGAKFHLNLVRNRARDDRQRADVDHVDEMLKEVIERSRSLSYDLSPAVLHMNDLAEVLQWLANRVRAQHSLVVDVQVAPDMTLQSEAMTMFLFRTAQEMLFNVVKHAQVKEAALRVRRIGRHVCLDVSDQGRGFDPQELKETSGFGLLSIRERVQLLGGRMNIRSAEGQGSRFRVVVPDGPRVKDREKKAEAGVSAPATVSVPSSDGVLRVLLVDDHEIVRQGLGSLLQETPDVAVVGAAANGRDAIHRANELRPDVVIMDVSMPVMSGEEATRQIKTLLPETRVIALSMYGEPEKMAMMHRAGAEGYVLKTASSEELLAAIRGSRPRREN
jgi:PAS domain S-box-containing protein